MSILTDDEIVRRLKLIRYSPAAARLGRKATSINALAKAAGLTREHLHRVANGLPIGPRTRQELSRVLSREQLGLERTGEF